MWLPDKCPAPCADETRRPHPPIQLSTHALGRRTENVVPRDGRGTPEPLADGSIASGLDRAPQSIRRNAASRSVRSPTPYTGHPLSNVWSRVPAAEPDVSVRSLIIALGRFGIASVEEAKALEKRWAAYRKAQALDLHGKPAVPATEPAPFCAH